MNNISCSVEGDSSNNSSEWEGTLAAEGSLALHIRRLRQWYGEEGLSQTELAEFAGLSLRQLQRYESSRSLPLVLEAILAIALVLKVPIERLIDPRRIERLNQAIEQRRAAQEGMANQPPTDYFTSSRAA